jgi:hypothetical protein
MKAPFFAVSLFTSLSLCGVALAQLTKLTIGSNTLSGSGLPAWVAKDVLGYFARMVLTCRSFISEEEP